MSIEENLQRIKETLPDDVNLCAVSKFHGIDKIMSAYNAGQRIFGESRVQELQSKKQSLPDDIRWHFIGHLQTNKVKQLVPIVSMIESVDSDRLFTEISRCCDKEETDIDVLLEIHVAQEATKSGFTLDECRNFLREGAWHDCKRVHICGLMTMASNTDDTGIVESDFQKAEDFFAEIKHDFFSADPSFKYRSWGMSGDYPIALHHSANIVRVGTAIFGPREY